MEMILHLKDEIFDLVKNGSKNIEIRLYDEKRRKLNVGDILIFYKNGDESKKVIAKVEELNIFDNIEELVNNYDLRNMYFEDSSKEELISIFNEIYSKDKQEEYKVVAIKFEKKEKSCGVVVFNDKQEYLKNLLIELDDNKQGEYLLIREIGQGKLILWNAGHSYYPGRLVEITDIEQKLFMNIIHWICD